MLQYKSHSGKFPDTFFKRNAAVAQSKTHVNAREVMELLALKPGEYLIVPSTFKPNETASYLLTILSKAETHIQYATLHLTLCMEACEVVVDVKH